MIRNTLVLAGALMLMTACDAPPSELTAAQDQDVPAVAAAGVGKSAASPAVIATAAPAGSPIQPGDGVLQLASAASAEEDPMEEQRCVWRCLADSKGNTDPAYKQCVAAQCGGESESDDDGARSDDVPAGSAWLVGSWAPDGLCAEDASIAYRANGTYEARSPGGEAEDTYETGRWKVTGSRITWVATGGSADVRRGRTASGTIMRGTNEFTVKNLRGETAAVWSFTDESSSTSSPLARCD